MAPLLIDIRSRDRCQVDSDKCTELFLQCIYGRRKENSDQRVHNVKCAACTHDGRHVEDLCPAGPEGDGWKADEHSVKTSAFFEEIRRGLLATSCQVDHVEGFGGFGLKGSMVVRTLPTTLLYDERGLELFEEITYLTEYYLTAAEIDIFQQHAMDIVRSSISTCGLIVELGVGSMRKTRYILDAITQLGIPGVTYIALDLCDGPLRESLGRMAEKYPDINFVGLVGTYNHCLDFIHDVLDKVAMADGGRGPKCGFGGPLEVPKLVMWLGSSIGNYTREEAAAFVREVAQRVMVAGDHFLLGVDRRNPKGVVELAYNDPQGVTREFILNGLRHANNMYGREVFVLDQWQYAARYNEDLGRHEAYYESVCDQVVQLPVYDHQGATNEVETISFFTGELIHVEYSYKYSEEEVRALGQSCGMTTSCQWTDSGDRYDLYLLSRPGPPSGEWTILTSAAEHQEVPMTMKNEHEEMMTEKMDQEEVHGLVSLHKKGPVHPGGDVCQHNRCLHKKKADLSLLPGWDEWEALWKLWDLVSTQMVPEGQFLDAPICLRHPFLFYLGHVPAFTDIQMSRYRGEPYTHPEGFVEIFERGIDPNMDDPSLCHPHSRVPEKWPPLQEVLEYRDRVRTRMRGLYRGMGLLPGNEGAVGGAHDTKRRTDSVDGMPSQRQGYVNGVVLGLVDNDPEGDAGVNGDGEVHEVDEWNPGVEVCTGAESGCCPRVHEPSLAVQTVNGSVTQSIASEGGEWCSLQQVDVGGLVEVLWMCFEHEAMHLETFLYMLVQHQGVQPPPHVKPPATAPPPLYGIADGPLQSGLPPLPPPAQWVPHCGGPVVLGVSRSPGTGGGPLFSWDNERPSRTVEVASFQLQHRPVTVGEYYTYLEAKARAISSRSRCTRGQGEDMEGLKDVACKAPQHFEGLACLVPSSWVPLPTDPDMKTAAAAAGGGGYGGGGYGGGGGELFMTSCPVPVTHMLNGKGAADPHTTSNNNASGARGEDAEVETLDNGVEEQGGQTEKSGKYDKVLPSHPNDIISSRRLTKDQQPLPDHGDVVISATGFGVRTVFGPLPLEQCWLWPVAVSGYQAELYAQDIGARLPTEEELLHVRDLVEDMVGTKSSLPWKWPAECESNVGPLLICPHVQDSLVAPQANVSFTRWHPTDVVVHHEEKLLVTDIVGQGWEWTSTVLCPHPGFSPSPLYPGYTSDFLDGRHWVLLGASWATHYRIAGRRTFRNFYQTGYPYVFSKFRCCRGDTPGVLAGIQHQGGSNGPVDVEQEPLLTSL